MQKTIEVIFENQDILVFYKPKNIPTVPLKGQEGDTLLSLAAADYPEILSPYGKNPWEGTILHRLDTPTSGLVLAARNKETFLSLSALQEKDEIKKVYIISSFRSFGPKGASVRPLWEKRKGDERIYRTHVEYVSEERVKCTITRGFRHQIRSHLAWSGHPIVGDERYGGKENDFLLLEAVSISFPYKKGVLEISI